MGCDCTRPGDIGGGPEATGGLGPRGLGPGGLEIIGPDIL